LFRTNLGRGGVAVAMSPASTSEKVKKQRFSDDFTHASRKHTGRLPSAATAHVSCAVVISGFAVGVWASTLVARVNDVHTRQKPKNRVQKSKASAQVFALLWHMHHQWIWARCGTVVSNEPRAGGCCCRNVARETPPKKRFWGLILRKKSMPRGSIRGASRVRPPLMCLV
jgi:hypothetical protein